MPGTGHDDIPIFTLNDVVAMLDRAQENLQRTTHTVFHKGYTSFRNEAEKQARAVLSAELAKFYRDRGLFR
jgi:BMFP domain-containing protein YqiC